MHMLQSQSKELPPKDSVNFMFSGLKYPFILCIKSAGNVSEYFYYPAVHQQLIIFLLSLQILWNHEYVGGLDIDGIHDIVHSTDISSELDVGQVGEWL